MRNCLTIIITGLLLLFANVGVAQDKITEELNSANLIFEEGKILESLELLKGIEKKEGLSKTQEVRLYRQMTICYIFLDKDNVFLKDSEQTTDTASNIRMAQNSYLNLLHTNNIYEVDSMDIIDYVRFTKKFSSKPIIILNPKVGLNTSIVDVLEYYGTSNHVVPDTAYYSLGYSGTGPYKNVYTNLSFGLDVDWNFYNNFNLSIGGNYTQRSFLYDESLLYSESIGNNEPFKLSFQEKQQWIDLTLKVKYDIGKSKTLIPYVYAGATYHSLISDEFTDVQRSFTENLSIEEANILDARFTNNYSFVGGGGLRWRVFDKHFFTINAEYGRMIEPINNIENRYTSNAANTWNYAFGYVDNDIRLNNVSFMIGFAYAFYNPKMIKTDNEK